MTQTKLKKTNKQWYLFEEQGAYFKLVNGELWMALIDENGKPYEDNKRFAEPKLISEEEWYEDEPMTWEQMIHDLEGKV